jgi:hypothetical protein
LIRLYAAWRKLQGVCKELIVVSEKKKQSFNNAHVRLFFTYLFADIKVLVGGDLGQDGDEACINDLDQVGARMLCRDVGHQPKTLFLDRSNLRQENNENITH